MSIFDTLQRSQFTRASARRIAHRIRCLLNDNELARFSAQIGEKNISHKEFITSFACALNSIAAQKHEIDRYAPLSIDDTTRFEQWQKKRTRQIKIPKKNTAITVDLLAKLQQIAFGVWSLPIDDREPMVEWNCLGEKGKRLYTECNRLYQRLHRRIYRQNANGELHCNPVLREPTERVSENVIEPGAIRSISNPDLTLHAALVRRIDSMIQHGDHVCRIVNQHNFKVDTTELSQLLAAFEVDFFDVYACTKADDGPFERLDILIGDIMSAYYEWAGKSERYTNQIDPGQTTGLLVKIITVIIDEFGYPISRANLRRHVQKNADVLEYQRIFNHIMRVHYHDLNKSEEERFRLILQSVNNAGITYRNRRVPVECLKSAISQAVKLRHTPYKKFKPQNN